MISRLFSSVVFVCLSISLFSSSGLAAVVIQYHHISEQTPAATSTSPAVFSQHMEHLHTQGYKVVPLTELTDAIRQNQPLPDRTIAITFDDGYRSICDTAFPVLKKYNFPFTIFIQTEPIENNLSQFCSWDELNELAKAGATLANHSQSHAHLLRRLTGESEAQWRQRMETEVRGAENIIAQRTGQRHRLFAYPYGEYDADLIELLDSWGFIAFGQESGPINLAQRPQALSRFPFGGIYGDLNDFATKIATKAMPIKTLQATTERGVEVTTLLPAESKKPLLKIELGEKIARSIQCYASGQGAIKVTVINDFSIQVQANRDLPVGRSRYNCTAATGERGRFFWVSQPFIRKREDGQWYEEP